MKQTQGRPPYPTQANRARRIADLQRDITAKVDRLADLQGPQGFSFFFQQLGNGLRRQGKILPGDGKGGLIQPSAPGASLADRLK